MYLLGTRSELKNVMESIEQRDEAKIVLVRAVMNESLWKARIQNATEGSCKNALGKSNEGICIEGSNRKQSISCGRWLVTDGSAVQFWLMHWHFLLALYSGGSRLLIFAK